MAKRYVLLVSERDASETEKKELRAKVERMYRGAKLIEVGGNSRAVILKTTNEVAPLMKGPEWSLEVEGNRWRAALTSGAVGNLKRRAKGVGANGQVHE